MRDDLDNEEPLCFHECSVIFSYYIHCWSSKQEGLLCKEEYKSASSQLNLLIKMIKNNLNKKWYYHYSNQQVLNKNWKMLLYESQQNPGVTYDVRNQYSYQL